ncbi:cupin domain-containing protein [Pseudomonas sp. P7759]|uniref:cupin domain-containing protein n=1 Tax=Pseudomonas sp. P7759 TaxID=2738831 RepID=UPI0015A1F604|nr:cupin domain-containing protein [Pseudomonas sp. P7759]NWC77002.1 cupin domain-containing protein [Pseudomonas sp. P7759]
MHTISGSGIFDIQMSKLGGGLSTDDLERLKFEPYQIDGREGVSIFHLYDARQNDRGPVAALVRYNAGAFTPRHMHLGWELVLVLKGELLDDRGRHAEGVLQVYPPGSSHELSSVAGCTFLVVWEQPVQVVTSPEGRAGAASTAEADL